MSLALATHGYLVDENLSVLPIGPDGGQAHVDPPPKPPRGCAKLENPPPKPPRGGGILVP